ncbi:hypothetical protein AOC36_08705 [Erysipelothrix larvae]|uniref:Polysaccharide pyruvyl transferase domain-containing protein n=1 Tax=Erysipelothrix larvae TaxID=1514105 RepID=A0A120JTW0_9FIRM|nr:polysaccharide pyruvyl transferase family protein [Erysipelothrix larvae]AMC94065.1 hypothetical protein AOC36_08705 [Erysipelothrix larvae]
MKKIFFAYQYSMENAGDFAINVGSLDLLSSLGYEITVMSKNTKNNEEYSLNERYIKEYYTNVKMLPGPFDLNRDGTIKTLISYTFGFVKLIYYSCFGQYKSEINSSNFVVLNGGNVLRCNSITDYIRLFALIFPLKLSISGGVQYALFPQSTTTINRKGKKLLEKYMDNAKIVFARENISYNSLQKTFNNANIIESLDSAYFIRDRENVLKEFEVKYDDYLKLDRKICITLRKEDIGDIGELSKEKRDKIENKIISFISQAIKGGYSIVLVIQTKKDKKFTEDIFNKVNSSNISIIEEYNPLFLREIYRNSECLVGMRLHSIILAMSVGTPVVGYFDEAWGIKNPGTLSKFNMPYCYLNSNDSFFTMINEAKSNKELMNETIQNCKLRMISDLENVINNRKIVG